MWKVAWGEGIGAKEQEMDEEVNFRCSIELIILISFLYVSLRPKFIN